MWTRGSSGAYELGEHPIWLEDFEELVWVDCLAGTVHARQNSDEDTTLWESPWGSIGAVGRAIGEQLVVTTGDRVVVVTPATGASRLLAHVPHVDGVRFNDAAVDPVGRLVFGTTGAPREGLGALYSLEDGAEPVLLLDGLMESNGLDWSTDGATMYHTDSGVPEIHRYRYNVDSGQLSDREVFAVLEDDGLCFDGIAVDAEDHVWACIWGGAAIHRYSPSGELVLRIPTPTLNPTCPAIDTRPHPSLHVTTARLGAAVDDPWAGAVLRMEAPAKGIAPRRFAQPKEHTTL